MKTRRAYCKKVICIETGEIYYSVKEAAEAIGRSSAALSQCLNKLYGHDTCAGLHFEFYKEDEKEESTNE